MSVTSQPLNEEMAKKLITIGSGSEPVLNGSAKFALPRTLNWTPGPVQPISRTLDRTWPELDLGPVRTVVLDRTAASLL